MPILHKLLFLTFLFVSCQTGPIETSSSNKIQKSLSEPDTIPKVTGIGGIFFKAKNPSAVKKWYGENLGLSVDHFGSPFEFRNAHKPEQINYLNWDAFIDTTSYMSPSDKEFMINYRVQNIESLVKKLKKNGVQVLDEIIAYEYGKFVHIMDLEGNKIELWEPIDSVLTKMGRKTTK